MAEIRQGGAPARRNSSKHDTWTYNTTTITLFLPLPLLQLLSFRFTCILDLPNSVGAMSYRRLCIRHKPWGTSVLSTVELYTAMPCTSNTFGTLFFFPL